MNNTHKLYEKYKIGEPDILQMFPFIEMNVSLELDENDNLASIKDLLYEFDNNENIIIKCIYSLDKIDKIFADFESYNDYKEALANESMVGSIAHSVVLVRLNDAKDADAAVQAIKDNVDPRKWICIEASNVVVKSKGDLVILIMSNEDLAPKLEANFDNL